MELVAGVGGMFGQLAVGLAGGEPAQTPGLNMAAKLQAARQKSDISSLPDKVLHTLIFLGRFLP